MKSLSDYTITELESEIVRQKRDAEINNALAPKPLENPDYSSLVELCSDYIKELTEKHWADDDFPHYIYETALTCVFGKHIFTYINKMRS